LRNRYGVAAAIGKHNVGQTLHLARLSDITDKGEGQETRRCDADKSPITRVHGEALVAVAVNPLRLGVRVRGVHRATSLRSRAAQPHTSPMIMRPSPGSDA
jgi:hypothetical protein